MPGFHTYDIGHLVPVGGGDIKLSTPLANLKWTPGQQAYMQDKLGSRYLQYCKTVTGVTATQGQILSKAGDASGETAFTGVLGSTTHVTATGLTALLHEGALIYSLNKAATAGAAPEGEIAIAKGNNTTTRIDFDANYPFSVAVAVNDTFVSKAQYGAQLAASGDFSPAVLGAVMCPEGMAANEYAWVQKKGRGRVVTVNTIAPAVHAQAIVSATAGAVDAVAAGSAFNLVIGYFFFAIGANDLVNDLGWVDLRCDEYCISTSTLDATA